MPKTEKTTAEMDLTNKNVRKFRGKTIVNRNEIAGQNLMGLFFDFSDSQVCIS